MEAFRRTSQGYSSHLEDWEKDLLSSLVLDTAHRLRDGQAPAPEPATGATGGAGGDEGDRLATPATARAGESQRDAELLAALDFPAPQDGAGHDPAGATRPVGQVESVLLPAASTDPVIAAQVRELTSQRLRALKLDRLTALAATLATPGRRVLVASEEAGALLAALNDLRLVLASHLGVEGPEDAEAVHELVTQPPPPGGPASAQEALRLAHAVAYELATWWQESLLAVMLGEEGPA